MQCPYACNSVEHAISRRGMLGGLMGGAFGLGGLGAMGLGHFARPAVAEDLAKRQKRVLVIFLSGGASQLETWDPKPGTDTGGPFLAIPTSVPGIHISELLPYSAQQMHRLSIVRGVNTVEDDHGKGAYIMDTGRRDTPATRYPGLGSAVSKLLAPAESPLPGYVRIGGAYDAGTAFLGPRFGSVDVADGKPPANLLRPDSLAESADRARNSLRKNLNGRFSQRRRTAETEAYSYSFDQAAQLMERKEIFDLSREPATDVERYGNHDFGRQCLMARRLLEHGIACVKVTHSNYDTHFENFDYHIEQLGEFDKPFATLIADLADRGMLESTLVTVVAEFGRTPRINHLAGRDHWSHAWSVAMAGCGLHAGAVVGKTNDNGTEVIEREVNGGHLFHTYFRALGVDSSQSYELDGREMPIADPSASPIQELLV